MNQILYQAPADQETKKVSLSKVERNGDLRVGQAREFPFGSVRRTILLLSNLLLAISITGLIVYYWPVIGSEASYFISSKFSPQGGSALGRKVASLKLAEKLNDSDNLDVMPQINGETPKSFVDILTNSWQTDALAAINAPDSEFSLVIPKISASAKVIANVDAGNPKAYNEALRNGIAHAAGSVLPGLKGTTYLFAHSTDGPWNVRRFNAIFYLLKEMEAGDEIVVFFEGKKFFYNVTEKSIKDPGDTQLFKQKDKEILVLQTCWPPGTTKQVLLVTAERK